MSQPTSPPVQRRILAGRLRRFRVDSGRTLQEVAARTLISVAMLSRMETGERPAKPLHVKALADAYGLEAADTAELLRLASEAQGRAWWREYSLPSAESTYVGLETAADSLRAVDLGQIHGLAQTENYARELLLGLPGGAGDDERVGRIVESRSVRQRRLWGEAPLTLDLLLGEASLLTQVGAPAVMHEQLTRLLELSELPSVTLRVLPFAAGVTAPLLSPFNVLRFAATSFPRVVYVEGVTGELVFDQPADVDAYEAALASTLVRAHDPAASRRLIEKVRSGWSVT